MCDAFKLRKPPAHKKIPDQQLELETLLMNPAVFKLEAGNAKKMIELVEACLRKQ